MPFAESASGMSNGNNDCAEEHSRQCSLIGRHLHRVNIPTQKLLHEAHSIIKPISHFRAFAFGTILWGFLIAG
jgi:hypothetical protein